ARSPVSALVCRWAWGDTVCFRRGRGRRWSSGVEVGARRRRRGEPLSHPRWLRVARRRGRDETDHRSDYNGHGRGGAGCRIAALCAARWTRPGGAFRLECSALEWRDAGVVGELLMG